MKNDVLKSLLESEALDESLKTQLAETFEAKLEEAREEVRETVEAEVRSDLARRYETDRAKMVEAMDKFMTEAISKELREFNDDRQQVYATRAKLAKQIRENKENHAAQVQESIKALEGFVLSNVKGELKEFMTDKVELAEEKKVVATMLNEHKANLNKVTAGRITDLEKFVVKKLTEEIGEFETDKQALVEAKVNMAREAKVKLDETRKTFITRSAALVEKTLRESLSKEFTTFRDDIKEARENHFGRKIFEAYAAEYMTSYLSEGSEVKKLQGKLEESKSQTKTALTKLTEQQDLIKGLDRKVKVSEDSQKRAKIMSELLSPLSSENKGTMDIVLSNVKTSKLREAFKKHLSSVLNESTHRGIRGAKETITESAAQKKTVAISGNREDKQPVKASVQEVTDASDGAEVYRLRALAGIK